MPLPNGESTGPNQGQTPGVTPVVSGPGNPAAGVAGPAPTAPAPPAAPGDGQDRLSFADAVLTGLGAPHTQENINALLAWMTGESGANGGAAFNPLNTTQGAPGATNFNSVGVKDYTSFEQGVAATVQTLKNGSYGGVLNAFQSGNSAQAVGQAVANSPWGTGTLLLSILGQGGGHNGSLGSAGGTPVTGGATGANAFNSPLATTYNAQQLESQYGLTAAYFDGIPELKSLIGQAVAGQWDPTLFKSHLMNTQWYKTTTDAARQLYTLQKTDPATAARQQQQSQTQIQNLAGQFGIALKPADIAWLGMMSQHEGWNQGQIQAKLSSYVYGDGATVPGQQVTNMAKQYLVPLSQQAQQNLESLLVAGNMDTQSLTAYFAAHAKSLYPTMGTAIDQGITPAQYADPYKQVAASTLEIDPNTIDFMQPKWNKALMQLDPKTGQRTAMNLSDWTNTIRTDPTYGYDTTNGARVEAGNLANKIMTNFGFGGA